MNRLVDAAHALRDLLRHPGFLVLASSTLAIGTAALLGALTLLDALLLQAPPWPNHAAVAIYGGRTASDPMRAASPKLYDTLGQPPGVLSRGMASMPETVNVRLGGHEGLLRAQRVTPGFLPTLGVIPTLGGMQSASIGSGDVLVSDALWRAWMADTNDVVGRLVTVDGQRMRVRGVLPADYRFFAHVDLLLPLPSANDADTDENLTAVARLAPGYDAETFSVQVARAVEDAADDLKLQRVDLPWYGATAIDDLVARAARTRLWAFTICGLLVLVVAAVTLAQLMLTRALDRSHETALMMVFGAGRWQGWSTNLAEASIIGLIASMIGLPLGMALVGIYKPFIPSEWLNSALPLSPRWHVLLLTSVVTLLAAWVANLAGALNVYRALLLRERNAMIGFGGTVRWRRVRTMMLVTQVALATCLLALGVAATERSWRLTHAPMGFDSDNAMVVELHPPVADYPARAELVNLLYDLRASVSASQGVDHVGWSTQLPVGQGLAMPFRRPDGQYAYVRYVLLTAGAAQALGMHKVAGRWLDEDDSADTLRVALVNEAYLHRIDAVGIGGAVRQGGSSAPPARIVGVVEDTYAVAGQAAEPTVFLAFSQVDAPSLARVRALAPLYAIVRGSEASAAVHDVLTRWAHVIAPSLAVAPARSLDEAARLATVASRRDALLFATLSLLAVGLAAVGHYSVQSVEVATGRSAIALQGALGATPTQLLFQVVRRGGWIGLIGTLLGLSAVLVVQQSWYAESHGSDAVGPAAIMAVVVVMLAVTLSSVLAPARRAAAVEPWWVLRSS